MLLTLPGPHHMALVPSMHDLSEKGALGSSSGGHLTPQSGHRLAHSHVASSDSVLSLGPLYLVTRFPPVLLHQQGALLN